MLELDLILFTFPLKGSCVLQTNKDFNGKLDVKVNSIKLIYFHE